MVSKAHLDLWAIFLGQLQSQSGAIKAMAVFDHRSWQCLWHHFYSSSPSLPSFSSAICCHFTQLSSRQNLKREIKSQHKVMA